MRRANAREVSQARAVNAKNKIDGPPNLYVGSTQRHLIRQDRWANYPMWRRENGKGHSDNIISEETIRREVSLISCHNELCHQQEIRPASNRFEGMPKLKSNRRDEFTVKNPAKLHSAGRKWMREATTPQGT